MTPSLLTKDIVISDCQAFEKIAVVPDTDQDNAALCPRALREKIMIDVIHDGNCIPPKFLTNRFGKSIVLNDEIRSCYIKERDWGAEILARHLASALHLESYYRINIARVLLDFGRFPGITHKSADHMNRFAINYPFSEVLSFQQKRHLLEDYYDIISEHMDYVVRGKLIKIAIHTYDETNTDNIRRPAVSIVTRSHGHQRGFASPIDMFDPLVPHELAEFTADTILRSRIALTFEEAAIRVADNYPYPLPEGSVEVRAQVWYFFRHVQQEYEKRFPQEQHDVEKTPSPRDMIWNMLLDTNLRSAQSEALRSYLHMYRKSPKGDSPLFKKARKEYGRIANFINDERHKLINDYLNSTDRLNSIAIEIRKDLLWNFHNGIPQNPRYDDAKTIARVLAKSIQKYLLEDRPAKAHTLATSDPRYR